MNNNYPRQYINNYPNTFYQQSMNEQIDGQIAQLQQMKEQMKNNNQQPAINQTFQLAPTNNHSMRYVNTIDDVNKETTYYDTPFFSKDMSVVWIKNAKGDIKTYELNEIIPKDDKDILISSLQMQIEELRKEVKQNAKPINTNDDEPTSNEKSSNVQYDRTSTKKSK